MKRLTFPLTLTAMNPDLFVAFALAAACAPPALAQQGKGLAERFRKLDRNGDGKVTAAEFPGPQFRQMGRNGDGFVTPEEVQVYFAVRRTGKPNSRLDAPLCGEFGGPAGKPSEAEQRRAFASMPAAVTRRGTRGAPAARAWRSPARRSDPSAAAAWGRTRRSGGASSA
ncbi:MAG: hypothetical protein FJ399_10695 [Verrucomicrobia bacterium]|nr:hypothetical protein [Verrucomicrobiota bacterium]